MVYNTMKNILNETRTDNGDLACLSTMNKNVDFFGKASSLAQKDDVIQLFREAFSEDSKMAIKNLFYLRDIRGGNGIRENFRQVMKTLVKDAPELVSKLLFAVPEIGRWDDLFCLLGLNKEVDSEIFDMIKSTLDEDMRAHELGNPISLISKWLPSCNATSKETKRLAKMIVKNVFNGHEKEYRKTLSKLRDGLRLVENNLRARDYKGIVYESLPSKAILKYTKAFKRNDEIGYRAFKDKLASNPNLITKQAENLFPYEIIRKLEDDAVLADSLWCALEKKKSNKRMIVVRDGSGSMRNGFHPMVQPFEIADSLAIYASERLTGEFEDTFITFSESPQIVDLGGCESLLEKMRKLQKFNEVANTDIEKVYELIFETSKGVSEEDYIDIVLIISDMQFDVGANYNQSTFDAMKKKFNEAGIKMPKMVYWNVNSQDSCFPTTKDEAVFLSGFSKNTLKTLLSGEVLSAEQVMKDVLSVYDWMIERVF